MESCVETERKGPRTEAGEEEPEQDRKRTDKERKRKKKKKERKTCDNRIQGRRGDRTRGGAKDGQRERERKRVRVELVLIHLHSKYHELLELLQRRGDCRGNGRWGGPCV